MDIREDIRAMEAIYDEHGRISDEEMERAVAGLIYHSASHILFAARLIGYAPMEPPGADSPG